MRSKPDVMPPAAEAPTGASPGLVRAGPGLTGAAARAQHDASKPRPLKRLRRCQEALVPEPQLALATPESSGEEDATLALEDVSDTEDAIFTAGVLNDERLAQSQHSDSQQQVARSFRNASGIVGIFSTGHRYYAKTTSRWLCMSMPSRGSLADAIFDHMLLVEFSKLYAARWDEVPRLDSPGALRILLGGLVRQAWQALDANSNDHRMSL